MGRSKKKFKINFESDGVRIFLVVLGSIFSMLVLTFSVLAIIQLQSGNYEGASVNLLLVFIILAFSRLVSLFKERTKSNLIRFILMFTFDVALGILVFFGKDNPYFYSLVGGLFSLTLIVSRVFKIVKDHSLRSWILNGILILLAALLAAALFTPYEEEYAYSPVIIVCFVVALTALIEVLSGAFSGLKFKTLFKIIIRTFALEIILGLLTLMVASAIMFMYFEPNIPTFADGLWYAFAIVTTIGFGDFYATTIIGRIISVLLGIYGIIVVAVITSIIVNFYNETAGKKDTKQLKDIDKDEKK